MLEIEDQLQEIKNETIETRALVIKTSQLVHCLSADIKAGAKRQEVYEQRLRWTSGAAYGVFVILMLGAFKLAWDARIDAIRLEVERKEAENTELHEELMEARKRHEERARMERKASLFYNLILSKKHEEILDQYDTLKQEPLSVLERSVFDESVERSRALLGQHFSLQAADKLRLQRWQEGVNAYESALRYHAETAFNAHLRLGIAEAYRHVGRPREAAVVLSQLVETADKETVHSALYQLAWCHMELRAWKEAINTWRTLLQKFPTSRYSVEAKRLLEQLTALH